MNADEIIRDWETRYKVKITPAQERNLREHEAKALASAQVRLAAYRRAEAATASGLSFEEHWQAETRAALDAATTAEELKAAIASLETAWAFKSVPLTDRDLEILGPDFGRYQGWGGVFTREGQTFYRHATGCMNQRRSQWEALEKEAVEAGIAVEVLHGWHE